jgi:hypothetical protein
MIRQKKEKQIDDEIKNHISIGSSINKIKRKRERERKENEKVCSMP